MIEDDLWTFLSSQLEGVDLNELDDVTNGVLAGACLFARYLKTGKVIDPSFVMPPMETRTMEELRAFVTAFLA